MILSTLYPKAADTSEVYWGSSVDIIYKETNIKLQKKTKDMNNILY